MIPSATSAALTRVTRVRGVRCALLTSLGDALPIAASAHVDVDIDALSAFATAIFRHSCQAGEASGYGACHRFVLDASGGRLAAAGRADLLVVVLAERDTHPGLLRVSLQRALEEITQGQP